MWHAYAYAYVARAHTCTYTCPGTEYIPIDKSRPWHLCMEAAARVMREATPIKCAEVCVMSCRALMLTCDMYVGMVLTYNMCVW